MHCQTYSQLLWACWNLNKIEIVSGFYSVDESTTSLGNILSDKHSEDFDAWIAENRPDVCAAAMDGRYGGDDKDDHRQVLCQLKEFFLDTGRFCTEHGAAFPFLRRCPRLQRLRLPRFSAEDTRKDVTGRMDLWPDLEHLDVANFEPSRSWVTKSMPNC